MLGASHLWPPSAHAPPKSRLLSTASAPQHRHSFGGSSISGFHTHAHAVQRDSVSGVSPERRRSYLGPDNYVKPYNRASPEAAFSSYDDTQQRPMSAQYTIPILTDPSSIFFSEQTSPSSYANSPASSSSYGFDPLRVQTSIGDVENTESVSSPASDPLPDPGPGFYRCECGSILSNLNRSKNHATHEKSSKHRKALGLPRYQSRSLRCRHCGRDYSRTDACNRHERSCPQRPGSTGKKRKAYRRRSRSPSGGGSTGTGSSVNSENFATGDHCGVGSPGTQHSGSHGPSPLSSFHGTPLLEGHPPPHPMDDPLDASVIPPPLDNSDNHVIYPGWGSPGLAQRRRSDPFPAPSPKHILSHELEGLSAVDDCLFPQSYITQEPESYHLTSTIPQFQHHLSSTLPLPITPHQLSTSFDSSGYDTFAQSASSATSWGMQQCAGTAAPTQSLNALSFSSSQPAFPVSHARNMHVSPESWLPGSPSSWGLDGLPFVMATHSEPASYLPSNDIDMHPHGEMNRFTEVYASGLQSSGNGRASIGCALGDEMHPYGARSSEGNGDGRSLPVDDMHSGRGIRRKELSRWSSL